MKLFVKSVMVVLSIGCIALTGCKKTDGNGPADVPQQPPPVESQKEVPQQVQPEKVMIIPVPVKMQLHTGRFELTATTMIIVDSQTKPTGEYFAQLIKPATGFNLQVVENASSEKPDNCIVLKISDQWKSLGNEGYYLNAGPKGIIIEAPAPAGVFYGCQTIRQMLGGDIERKDTVTNKKWIIPAVQIEDQPRFSWRGSLLDSCRHIQSVEFIKNFIDLLAYHKMNRLHWHLTEDQGWRIEIKKYPKLTEIGAWRDAPDGKKYGGFFTQEQIRDVVAYAKARHVLVVPEIEMPGHSVAAVTCYPELSCTGGPFKVRTAWGVSEDVYCAGNDKTFEFIEDVLTETMDLFDSPWIHIGGDECPKDRWQNCPKCQARIKQQDLKNEHELQSYFIKRVETFLNSKGRRLIGWDEILEGGLSPNATVQSWRGMGGGTYAANEGHDVIMSPTSHCYLDYSYENISIEKAYSFEPVPQQLDAEKAKHILGIEGNLWTERMPTEQHVQRQAFPRLCALAEVGWSPKERNWENFAARLSSHLLRLGIMGVNYYIPEPFGFDRQNVFTDEFTVEIKSPLAEAQIRYTLDGTEPTRQSTLYTGPIKLTETTTLMTATFLPNAQSAAGKAVFKKETLRLPAEPGDVKPGLSFDYFEGTAESVKNLDNLKKISGGIIKTFQLPENHRSDAFAVEFNGYLKVEKDGIYSFYTSSDDGSCLYIGDDIVVDNDGPHAQKEEKGQAVLKAGLHRIRVRFTELSGNEVLEVRFAGPGLDKTIIPESALFH